MKRASSCVSIGDHASAVSDCTKALELDEPGEAGHGEQFHPGTHVAQLYALGLTDAAVNSGNASQAAGQLFTGAIQDCAVATNKHAVVDSSFLHTAMQSISSD